MKKFNKGMVITSTIAAAIAAMTLAGCGNTAEELTKAETAKAAANTVVAKNAAKASEVTAENKEETKTAAQPVVTTFKQTEAPAVIPEEVYPVWVEGDVYAGTYAEKNAGRGTMEITRNSDGSYSVEVGWSSSAAEKAIWNFSGEFDGRGVMNYTNCCKTIVAFNEDGSYACDYEGHMTPYDAYTNGSGYIKFLDEGVLEWQDDMGDVCPGTIFVSCKQSYNKADEVGTAGSNYYANEGEWEATGELYEVTGKRIRIEISKSNMGEGLYDVVVTASGSAFDSEVYGFLAHYENDTLVYDRGARSCVSYNSDGSIAENYIIDEGHSGTITYTGAAGIRWTDSDGSSYVFMHDITLA